jgi:Domain of unknown function (DUF4338)
MSTCIVSFRQACVTAANRPVKFIDCQRMYGHPIYFPETFIDPERFRGTCYRAANWVLLGKNDGTG